MHKEAQLARGRRVAGVSIPISRRGSSKPLRGREWRKDLLVSWLFQTSIKLQTSIDRRFLRLGITSQEATVLIRCVEARTITPGQLAVSLGRDKSVITRIIDRLEASLLLTHDNNQCDRRFSMIKPTGKGKRFAQDLTCVFDGIRKRLFLGIHEGDLRGLCQMLRRLHKNAVRIESRRRDKANGRHRIGGDGMKSQAQESLTACPDGLDIPS
jgi:DNA-binding MarR family transcriptional regulator